MSPSDVECKTCKANRSELVAPGGVIHADELWQVEHMLEPLPMAGWLIVKPLRHVTAFADLTDDEAATFGPLVRRVMAALQRVTGAEKVYLCLFAEASGFVHLHFHLIPAMREWTREQRGPAVFELIGDAMRRGNLVDPAVAASLADRVRTELER